MAYELIHEETSIFRKERIILSRDGYSKVALLSLFLLVGSVTARAQTPKDSTDRFCRDAVYIELGGSGGLYSFNFDYRISKEIGFRLGFTAWSIVTAFPITVNYLVGWHAHHIELGMGAVVGFVSLTGGTSFLGNGPSTGAQALWWEGTIGYRYQPDDGGFVFRIDYTPLLEPKGIYSWGGISFGYAF